jgi:hypothetical protein
MVASNQKTQYTTYYNSKDAFLFINNVEINAFAEGEMFGITFPNDRQTLGVDAKGTGYFVQNNDRRANLTVNLSEVSVDNSMLTDILNASKPVPIKMVHNNESWTGMGLPQKAPDAHFSNTANARSWVFLMPSCTYANGNKS